MGGGFSVATSQRDLAEPAFLRLDIRGNHEKKIEFVSSKEAVIKKVVKSSAGKTNCRKKEGRGFSEGGQRWRRKVNQWRKQGGRESLMKEEGGEGTLSFLSCSARVR